MTSAPTLHAAGIHKSYGGVRALRGVDLELKPGEIHGLLGENGSGKSTLLKILAGQLAPDRGRLMLEGSEVRFADASRAMAAGIATVTQETTLVRELSVAENIFLGPRKARRPWGIDWRRTRAEAVELLERLGLDIDPATAAGRLRPDQQQMVEIARALSIVARVVILDEPTSSLPDDQVASLFEAVRSLRAHGVAVVFVSHRMSEIFDLVDRVTILRDGLVVGGGAIAEFDRARLIHLMIGRELEELDIPERPARQTAGAGLRLRSFNVPGRVRDVDLAVEPGEIVGLAGLVGSGRSSLLDGIFGLERGASGIVEIDGRTARIRDPLSAIRAGLGYVPADRKTRGLVLDMSVQANLLMAQSCRRVRLRRPRRAAEERTVADAVRRFRIVSDSAAAPVARLSGGNQQKVVLAKWLATEPRMLLLDEPTRGVDVGAKAEIYRTLAAIKDSGVGVLVSSSETPELLLLCDRILVMYRGRIVAELSRADATESRIMHYGMGHE
ncbi:MAG TPA: sugar ABC transporter ATP-binding protein [Solirubrobacteraceae bacterium]|nr:sugar ABC transporter ATP-binding protein [Solirubrobacteraceae bacterium]